MPTLPEGADFAWPGEQGADVPELTPHAVAGKVTVFEVYADWGPVWAPAPARSSLRREPLRRPARRPRVGRPERWDGVIEEEGNLGPQALLIGARAAYAFDGRTLGLGVKAPV